jgi:hypothetical protein
MAEREKSLPSEGALGGKAHTLRAAVGVLGSVSTGARNNNIPAPTFDAGHSFRDKDCRVGVAATGRRRQVSDEQIVDTGETISGGTQLTGATVALNGDGRVFTFRQQPTPLVHDEAVEAEEKNESKPLPSDGMDFCDLTLRQETNPQSKGRSASPKQKKRVAASALAKWESTSTKDGTLPP